MPYYACSQLYTASEIYIYSYQLHRNNNSNNAVNSSFDKLVPSWKFEHLHSSATISGIGYTLDLYIYKHVEGLCTVKAWVHLNWSESHISGHGGYMEQAMNF